jgi:hypothetical protein
MKSKSCVCSLPMYVLSNSGRGTIFCLEQSTDIEAMSLLVIKKLSNKKHSELMGFYIFSSSGILENRKHDVSEIGCFRPQLKGAEDTYSVGPLRIEISSF